MADKTKLRSLICSTFAALAVPCVARHCHGEELGPFC